MRSAQIFRIGAALVTLWLIVAAAAPASAQFYEETRRFLGFSPDPLERSPRLMGMGRLNYVVDDVHNRIQLWEFAGNPTGLVSADSISTLELTPTTAASSHVHDVIQPVGPYPERQSLASREVRTMFETWHRKAGAATYGLIGEYSKLRYDLPLNEAVERRTNLSLPALMGVVNGPMPYLWSDRMAYALRIHFGLQSSTDRFRQIETNAAGSYLDQDGGVGEPLEFFTPDESTIRSLGGGLAFSYRFGEPLTLAVGFDEVGHQIRGQNIGVRYRSEIRETRPTLIGQATATGRLASLGLEWGVDGRAWQNESKRTWVFSMSSGTASPAISGRGRFYNRQEEGTVVRSRVRWSWGNFEVGGGLNTQYQRIEFEAPSPTDTNSFNAFRNRLVQPAVPPATIASGDTLALPDSVASAIRIDQGWDGGLGAALRIPSLRTLIGVEVHKGELEVEQDLGGLGPRRTGWDLRSGAEFAATPVLSLRAGYIHRLDDQDDFVEQNELVGDVMTLGIGLTPLGTRWTAQAGYMMEWVRTDFGDPDRGRASRNQASLRISWRNLVRPMGDSSRRLGAKKES